MDKGNGQNDLMRYDLRVQEALRGAVRTIMNDIARTGFPGDHHFYISFRTRARGVQMSDRLRQQYPDEMTIVLQHQFWDLAVNEREFTVGLSFKQIAEKLVIPFNAITSFVDPTVQFALKFDTETAGDEAVRSGTVQTLRPAAPQPVSDIDRDEPLHDKTRPAKRPAPKPVASPEAEAPPEKAADKTTDKPDAPAPARPSAEKPAADTAGKIVSIDAFRKKP